MGIYDQGLANYQHGIDTAIQIQGQPLTLAASILGGLNAGRQQAFGNQMQMQHLGLQRDQLANAMRHQQMLEQETQNWHRAQEQDRFQKALDQAVIPDEASYNAWAGKAKLLGMDPSIVPRPQKVDTPLGAAFRQGGGGADWAGTVDIGGETLPVAPMPTTDQTTETQPAYGSAARFKNQTIEQRYAETARKEAHNKAMEDIASGKLDLMDKDIQSKIGLRGDQAALLQFKVKHGMALEPHEIAKMDALTTMYGKMPVQYSMSGGGFGGPTGGMTPEQLENAANKRHSVLIEQWLLDPNGRKAGVPMPTIDDARKSVLGGARVAMDETTGPNPALAARGGKLGFSGAPAAPSRSRKEIIRGAIKGDRIDPIKDKTPDGLAWVEGDKGPDGRIVKKDTDGSLYWGR